MLPRINKDNIPLILSRSAAIDLIRYHNPACLYYAFDWASLSRSGNHSYNDTVEYWIVRDASRQSSVELDERKELTDADYEFLESKIMHAMIIGNILTRAHGYASDASAWEADYLNARTQYPNRFGARQ